jgi:hypothetical protein
LIARHPERLSECPRTQREEHDRDELKRAATSRHSKHLRIELLDTIKAETVTAFESTRQTAKPTAA